MNKSAETSVNVLLSRSKQRRSHHNTCTPKINSVVTPIGKNRFWRFQISRLGELCRSFLLKESLSQINDSKTFFVFIGPVIPACCLYQQLWLTFMQGLVIYSSQFLQFRMANDRQEFVCDKRLEVKSTFPLLKSSISQLQTQRHVSFDQVRRSPSKTVFSHHTSMCIMKPMHKGNGL